MTKSLVATLAVVVVLTGCRRDGGGARPGSPRPSHSAAPSGGAGFDVKGDELHYHPTWGAFDPSGPKPEVDVEVEKGAEFNSGNGELLVPIRVTNNRDKTIQVRLNQCEAEAADGSRKKRNPPTFARGEDLLLAPGTTKGTKLSFGGKGGRLAGDSFRVYLWATITDGSGLVENMPVITLGNGPFSKPARPFGRPKRDDGAVKPAPTPPAPGAPTKECSACGARFAQDAAFCPECGAR